MSILPRQGSPEPLTATDQTIDALVTASGPDPSPLPTWRIEWRAILPARAHGGRHAMARVEAFLSPDGIELTLYDQLDTPLNQRWFEAIATTAHVDDRLLMEWRSAEENAPDPVLVRILLQPGREPLTRTTLPARLGLPGGRYDLLETGTISNPPSLGAS